MNLIFYLNKISLLLSVSVVIIVTSLKKTKDMGASESKTTEKLSFDERMAHTATILPLHFNLMILSHAWGFISLIKTAILNPISIGLCGSFVSIPISFFELRIKIQILKLLNFREFDFEMLSSYKLISGFFVWKKAWVEEQFNFFRDHGIDPNHPVFQYLFPALNIKFIRYEKVICTKSKKENAQHTLHQLQNVIDNWDAYIGNSNVLCSIFLGHHFEEDIHIQIHHPQFRMNKKELLENIKARLYTLKY